MGRKYGGSGLGLAICKKMCEAMNGYITCQSHVGKGSTFSFCVELLPATTQLATTQQIPHSPADEVQKSTDDMQQMVCTVKNVNVLLVEDNPINQKVAVRMLTSFGCQVQVAENGLVALQMFERDIFDIILMDVQMPILDGFQTTVRIRELEHERNLHRKKQHQQGEAEADEDEEEKNEEQENDERRSRKRIPIIALTASATREYQTKCLEKGMDYFLSKPLKKETLLRVLARVVPSTRLPDPSSPSLLSAQPSFPPNIL